MLLTGHQGNGGKKDQTHLPTVGESNDKTSDKGGQTAKTQTDLVGQSIKDQLGVGTETRVKGLRLLADVVPGNVLAKDCMKVLFADSLGLVLGRESEKTHLTIGDKEHDGSDNRELDDDVTELRDGLVDIVRVQGNTVDNTTHQQSNQGLTDTVGEGAKSS